MMTYLLLDIVFIGVILIFDTIIFKTNVWKLRNTWIVFGIIFALTLIFDSFLTSLPIVTYDYTKLLGVYFGNIPIEDFAYSLTIALLIPMLKRVIHE